MPVVKVSGGLKGLEKLIKRDMKARERRIQRAVRKAAAQGAKHARSLEPVAFGGLRESTRDEATQTGARVVADAPYSEALEKGSRPHMPPIGPIIRWVKLRGMQGLKSDKQLRRLRGSTTAKHARSIAQQIRDRMRADGSEATDIDVPTQIAWEIAGAIAKHGTKPHWFMRGALPPTLTDLDALIRAAMPDKETSE